MLNHGGNLQKAQQLYPDVSCPWLDLSTGISPWIWPVPAIPDAIWQGLPEQNTGFQQAVINYYGCALQPLVGSQQGIEIIPGLLSATKVAVPKWGYGEHESAWQKAGHELHYYETFDELNVLLSLVEHAVVINPNNPTGDYWPLEQLQFIQNKIPGYLLVDEAFLDAVGEPSMLASMSNGSLIVLRSLGKFFGLAGIRMGFVALPEVLQQPFKQQLRLWQITAPTLFITQHALQDKKWQKLQAERIKKMREELHQLLMQYFSNEVIAPGPLFISIYLEEVKAKEIFECFASHGIWLRLFEAKTDETKTYLRFGLAADLQAYKKVLTRL
ncbi:MAG: cobalamin biosynthetic protein CobC [Pseudohongiellaceae bacterium]